MELDAIKKQAEGLGADMPDGNTRMEPVHARVLPSLLIEQVKHSFSTWIGDIPPFELVRWTRTGMPSASVADAIRADALRRLRQHRPEIWARPMGIQLTPGRAQWLHSPVGAPVRQMMNSRGTQALHAFTFLDFKGAWRKPYLQVIAWLAELEGIDWIPPAVPAHNRHLLSSIRQLESTTTVALTDELREKARRALSLPWVDSIPIGDLRFHVPGNQSPADWVRDQQGRNPTSCFLGSISDSLLRADDLSYADEVLHLAAAAIKRCHPAHGGGNEDRWISMFLRRYVAPDAPRTLMEIGEEFEVTREWVRQVCESILEALRAHPFVTPSLDRVLRMGARVAPCSAETANEQLVRQLGANSGIRSAIALAKVLGRESPVQVSKIGISVKRKYENSPLLVPSGERAPWHRACLRYAAAECSTLGCTSVLRVAGLLALNDEVAPGRDAIESVISAAFGFRWLDEDNGWFSVGDTNGCGAATRLRKMLAVARDWISVDQVAEAFATDTRWFRPDDGRALAVPPTHVIQAMVLTWPWVNAVQYTRFVASAEFSPEGVLSDVESQAVEIIDANGGVAAAWQLYEGITAALPVSKMAVSLALATSAALVRFERGIYTLRGRRLKTDALAKARMALLERGPGTRPMDDESAFMVRVTEASLRHEQYSVPALFKSRLARGEWQVVGTRFVVCVTQSGALRGINQCLPELQPGDDVVIRLVDGGIAVALSPS